MLQRVAPSVPLLLIAVACTYGITRNAAVQIPGDLPTEEKIALAKSIAAEVWDGGLPQLVVEKFQVSEADLSEFGIRWNVMKIKPLMGEDTETRTTVHIQCSLRHQGNVPAAGEIVEFCEQKVREAMVARGIEPPAAR